MKFRCRDRKTGDIVQVEKISFHLGKVHVVNDFSIARYEIQRWDEEESDWLPASITFES